MKSPKELMDALSPDDKKLLNEILTIERNSLHEVKIKANSKIEKDLVKQITIVIDRAVPDEN